MLGGLRLAAVCITGSFGLQDSFNQSMVSDRLMKMGNVDEAVSGTFTQAQVNESLPHIQSMPELQAATGIFYMPRVARVFSDRNGLSTNDQYLYCMSPAVDQV